MSDENKAVVKSLFDELNKGNLGVIDMLIEDSFVEHEEMPPGVPAGKEGVKAFFAMLRGAFPDLQLAIEHVIAEGELVSVFLAMKGTQRGEFMGLPASGKAVSVPVSDLLRVQHGKITEHWGVMDSAAMMQQLGAGAA